jgi:predicted dehydrogenase
MERVKVMQVGIGGYGRTYIGPMLEQSPTDKYELVGVVDPLAKQSIYYEGVVKKNIPIYDTIEAFYQEKSADLVVIAAPIGYHCHYTVYALEHGSNVLCEKPVAATLQEVEQMRQAQLKSGKFVAIGFQWSYSPALLAAKRDFLSGKFGRAIQFKSHVLWERGWKYYARNNWAGKIRDRQGHWILDSVAHNATAHYLHNPYYMHGPALNQSAKPVSIQCELYRANDIENFDTCMLRAVTDQGCEVLYYVSHALHYNERPHFIYHFEKADLICNCDEPGFVEDCVYARYPDGTLVNYGPATPNPFSKQELCIDAILNGTADALPCGIEAATPHLFTINFLADHVPIHNFPAENIVRSQELQATYVPDLEKVMLRCYDQAKLPHELGDVAWAQDAQVFSTADYREFSGKQYS